MKRKKDKNGGTYVTATTKEEFRGALKPGAFGRAFAGTDS